MFRIFLFVSLISITNCWPFGYGMSRTNEIDPDVDLCNDPNLSGGVVADDGETYLFKGNYYWRTRPLTTDTGILGFAKLTASKWPEVKSNIKLVFTVPKDEQLMTVFVVKRNWFGYQKGVLVLKGTVDSWPDFNGLMVTAAFTPVKAGTLVYILHSDNKLYILYDFKHMSYPKKVKSGATDIRNNVLLFTEDNSMPGKSIETLINVRAGLTYEKNLILLSKESYCNIDLKQNPFERECNTRPINDVLNCPLDLKNRPSTKSSAIPIDPETATLESTSTELIETTSVSEDVINTVTVDELIASNWDSKESTSEGNDQIKTGIPILGRELEEDDYSEGNQTSLSGAGVEQTIYEKNSKNSLIWFIGFVLTLIAISVCALLVVGVVSKVKNRRRPKGQVFNTK